MKAFHEVRSYDSDFMVWCSTYMDISFLSHWHKEIELIYISEGNCRISIGDQSFNARGGDLLICDSGTIHYSDSYAEKNKMQFLIFDPGILSPVYEYSCYVCPHITKEQIEEFGLTENLKQLFSHVQKELKDREKYYQDIVKSQIREFWYLLRRHLPRNVEKEGSFHKRIGQMAEFQNFLSYMEEHYNENITLEFAAEQMNFSPSHFSRMFKRLTGINLLTYLNMIRVEQAMELLQNTNLKITEIALSCGFNNIRTFNRVFKEITGCTPSEFSGGSGEESISLYSKRKQMVTYQPSYYLQRYSQKRYVKNDSMAVINNTAD